jgi:hypothetical protein
MCAPPPRSEDTKPHREVAPSPPPADEGAGKVPRPQTALGALGGGGLPDSHGGGPSGRPLASRIPRPCGPPSNRRTGPKSYVSNPPRAVKRHMEWPQRPPWRSPSPRWGSSPERDRGAAGLGSAQYGPGRYALRASWEMGGGGNEGPGPPGRRTHEARSTTFRGRSPLPL